jgi:hypothetical protein
MKDQYFRFPRRLLTSPAWSVLNINERRAFDRIMVEHQSKSGFVNDGLPVTTRDFVSFGVQAKHVTSSMRVLRELGIMECTRNMGGSLSGRTPNLWRPTFMPRTPAATDATHDYLQITTREEARSIAVAHRVHDTRERMPLKLRRVSP